MTSTRLVYFVAWLAIAGCSAVQNPKPPAERPTVAVGQESSTIGRLEFLGEASLESGLDFEGTTVGGLSALAYDAATGAYFALADDPSRIDPTRLYELSIDIVDGRLEDGDVVVESVVLLRDADDKTMPTWFVDGEGLAISSQRTFFISSEGNVERGVEPFLREIEMDGRPRREIPLPERYRLHPSPNRGPRQNLAFEALSLSPDKRWLFAGMENALADDGPAADLGQPSPSRLLRYDLDRDRPPDEFLYEVEPVPQAPTKTGGFRVNGLVEILALDDQRLLALERAFSAGAGNSIRIYRVDLSEAENIRDREIGGRQEAVRAARKTLLLDLAELGLTLDNVEGMTIGPDLPDGRHTLVLISDDNFNPRQKTQVLAFAWSHHTPTLPQIQGAGHRSPYEGEWLFDVEGVVTAVESHEPPVGVWVQDPAGDNDPATSDGLFFEAAEPGRFMPGDRVHLSGRVVESARPGNLPVTMIDMLTARTLSRGEALPEPRALAGGIPPVIDDDSLTSFDSSTSAIDLFESLEGMRVTVPAPVAVGPSSRYGDFVVLADEGRGLGPRTAAGGIILTEESANPERIQMDPRLLPEKDRAALASVRVGSTFRGSLTGVLDYSWGMYEVVLTAPSDVVPPSRIETHRSPEEQTASELTVATFNVENLDALDPAAKFAAVAAIIVDDLDSPDIVGLQEIQDDNGAIDDGTVTADATFDRLVDGIVAGGGPRYEVYQIDPENNADGGQPGANIRVAYLVAPDRLRVASRPSGDATTTVRVEKTRQGSVGLSHNPGRVAANDPAFSFDERLGYAGTRKPLALEVAFRGRKIFLVNAHLKSKRGDDGLFGPVQPPQRHTERQRSAQTRAIRAFVDEILASDPEAAIIVLGDLNEHEFRPPVQNLATGALVNLIETVDLEQRYTYNFRGNSQVLDHVLVSPVLTADAPPGTAIAHVNADSPADERASDHDPIVVRLTAGAR